MREKPIIIAKIAKNILSDFEKGKLTNDRNIKFNLQRKIYEQEAYRYSF